MIIHTSDGQKVRIAPVYHLPSATGPLLSMGEFLKSGFAIDASATRINLLDKNGNKYLVFHPRAPGDNIFELAQVSSFKAQAMLANLGTIDYETMHRRFAHPSKGVLQKAKGNVIKFPHIEFPSKDIIC